MAAAAFEVTEQVRQAVGMEWESFEARHPNLARAIGPDVLVVSAARYLADSHEYRRAMADAEAAGTSAEVLAHVVRTFVGDWLRRLV